MRVPAGLWNPAHHSSERWVAGSLAAFPPQGCPCGDSSVPCRNLLSSVPSPASHPQCPSLHTVSVFCSHTHTLWTSAPPQSIPSLKSLISASPYPATAICPPSWSVQFLMPQGPLHTHRARHSMDPCPVSQAITSLPSSNSEFCYFSNTPLSFLSFTFLFKRQSLTPE